MSDNMQVNSVSPAVCGLGGAVLGGSIGYITAPKMYNLEQFLTLEQDTFTKAFSTKVLAKATNEQHSSMQNLRNARKAIMDAEKKSLSDVKFLELKKSKNVLKDFENIKNLIPKSKAESAVIGAIVFGMLAALGRLVFQSRNDIS